jgi:hypothetical protein
MNRGRVGEERGSKEMDGCPFTSSVVLDEVKLPIFLLDEEDRGSEG